MRDFMHPDRIAIGAFDAGRRRRGRRASTPRLEAPIVRCDVNSAEMIKLAANAALMTRISFINEIANVCEATGRRRRQGRRGDRARPAARAALPAGRARLRRQLLPEGLARAEAARLELRLPLPAARGGDRGERAPEAARDRQARAAPRPAARARRSRCSASPSSPDTDDMREAPSIVLAGRLLAEGAEVRGWDPVADGQRLPGGVEIVGTVAEAVARRRRRGDRDRVAGAEGARERRDARGDGEPADRRRPQPARPGRRARGRLPLRGHRPPRAPADGAER